MQTIYDVAVIGAGASGLVCARSAARRNRKVVVLDHNKAPGKKILMSGGGRCNFTNQRVTADHFISSNPHFSKSALSRFTPQDFINWVRRAKIPFEEREFGRLFCKGKASEILGLILGDCRGAGVDFFLDVGDTKCQSRHRIRSLFEVEPWIWNVRWRDACCILDVWESADDYLFSRTQLQAELHAAQHLKY